MKASTTQKLVHAFAASLLSFCLVVPLQAAPDSSEGISKRQAVSIAQQRHPGKVLSVRRSGSAYRVKSLSDRGQMRVIVVDAKSGKVISR